MTTEDMSPAQQSAIKQRRDDDDSAIQPSKKTAPTQAAAMMVDAAVATYPRAIQLIARSASKEYNILKANIRSQEKILLRFDDENEIPGSAKLNFKLTSHPEVMKTDEYNLLDTAMTKATKDFQSEAKKAIVGVAKLRLSYEKRQCKTALLTTLRRLCELALLEKEPGQTNPPITKLSWYIADKIDAIIFLFTHSTRAEVKHEIKRNLDDETQLGGNIVTEVQFNDEDKAHCDQLTTRLHPVIKSIFVDSWNAQLDNYRTAEIERTLGKKAKEMLTEQAAEETQMEIELDKPFSISTINDLIASAVNKQTKKQQAEIAKLREKLHRPTKNSNRGAGPSSPGASSKKKQATWDKTKDGKSAAKKGSVDSPGPKGKDSAR